MPSPPTVPETFRKIVLLFEKKRIPFVVVGGLAAGIQGEPRYTKDVDIMVLLKTGDIHRLVQDAKAEGFDVGPEEAESQWAFRGYVRMWLGRQGCQTAVDLMDCRNDFLREVTFRAEHTQFCGLRVPIASPEDMILMKVSAWREKDIPDARAIVNRHRDRLDIAYLKKWAAWISQRHEVFKEVPLRLEALLSGRSVPPAVQDPS